MRVVSLLPSTTEILFAIGAGEDVVGVTFECDHPEEARTRRIVSTSAIPPGLTPRQIDDVVAAALRRGEDLYHLEAGALTDLDPDLVVTQDLCAVCAVDVSVVDDALEHLGCRAEVVTIDPYTLEDVLNSIGTLGAATGRERAADQLVASLRARLTAVRGTVDGEGGHPPPRRPRVLVLEWLDPPFAPGHWIPEMVEVAGGTPALGVRGTPSRRVTWAEVASCAPDVVVCAPCGYGLDEASEQGARVTGRFPGVPVWAVDADASFARPGPRLVDGVECLAGIFHPDAAGPPDPAFARRLA